MVVTFNKRELIEFPQYTSKDVHLPLDEYVLVPMKEYSNSQKKLLFAFLENEGFLSENNKISEDIEKSILRNESNNNETYDLMLFMSYKEGKRFWSLQSQNGDSSWPKCKLSPEDFEKFLFSHYSFKHDVLGDDALKIYLRDEKGVEFIPKVMSN